MGLPDPVHLRGTCAPDVANLANQLLYIIGQLQLRPQWFSGSGAPSDTVGKNGDFYLDKDTTDIYLKEGGTWG